MIAGLYECFQHWSKSGSVYIISDTHFDDEDCKVIDPNWISADEQVEIINKKVHKADTLIVLGDIGNVDYIKKLKVGRKVLIMGNHDSGAENYKRVKKTVYSFSSIDDAREFVDTFYSSYSVKIEKDTTELGLMYNITVDNHLFDEVYEGPLFISEKLLLSHEPCELPFCANIHGHDHAGKMYHGNNINVASNVCNFTPISLAEEIKKGLISKVPTIHRICIDRATKNPVHKKGK